MARDIKIKYDLQAHRYCAVIFEDSSKQNIRTQCNSIHVFRSIKNKRELGFRIEEH